jgi:hypothetical protein
LRARRYKTAGFVAGAFCAALAAALLVLLVMGRGIRGYTIATQTAARVAFLFFWPTYAAGALPVFFGPAFEPVARHRREFGLAFAAALTVHLAFVAWLFHISYYPPVPPYVVFWFGIGAAWVYLLALGSLNFVREFVGETLWRLVSAAGLEYVAFLFFRDFYLLYHPPGLGHTLFYAPFAALIVVGAVLRWGGMAKKWLFVAPPEVKGGE